MNASYVLTCADIAVRFLSGSTEVRALEGVRFSCRQGEIVSIIGPSGCGKSTLLRVIAGLQTPSSGSLEYQVSNVRNSLVFQEGVLFPWLTVLQNASFGLEAAGTSRKEREELARRWLTRVGLSDRENAWPHELSAGMRQRVALVRSFLTQPDLLLMDEPFAALDAQTRLLLQQQLLDLWRESRPSILFVTHDIDEAILLGDRVLVLSPQPGRVIAEHRISLPRPRPVDTTLEPEFLERKAELLAALRLSNQLERAHSLG